MNLSTFIYPALATDTGNFINSTGSSVSYPLVFNYTNLPVLNTNNNNQDVLENLCIFFTTVSGAVSLQLCNFLNNAPADTALNPPFGQPVAIGGTSNLIEINPITPSLFCLGSDNVYRLLYNIVQVNPFDNLGAVITLDAGSSITGLTIGLTEWSKRSINRS